uniref:Ig-like domain-containing protein n=1 Tax=Sphaeramia orbicularis TaxID=375764 RepID=A0A673CDK1_9TELE
IKTVVNNGLSAVHSCRPLLTVSTCPPSGDRPLKPVVDVYQAASTAHLDGKTSLLCVASGMFPPEVRFSWKRQKGNGAVEDLPDAEGEQLEVQESGLFLGHPVYILYPFVVRLSVCAKTVAWTEGRGFSSAVM